MGMYDHVRVPDRICKCPKCGDTLSGWQSKDKGCTLSTVEWWDVDNFYTHCDCGEWVEYFRKKATPVKDSRVLEFFEMKHNKLWDKGQKRRT